MARSCRAGGSGWDSGLSGTGFIVYAFYAAGETAVKYFAG